MPVQRKVIRKYGKQTFKPKQRTPLPSTPRKATTASAAATPGRTSSRSNNIASVSKEARTPQNEVLSPINAKKVTKRQDYTPPEKVLPALCMPEKFLAQRVTEGISEILVSWQDYPAERDWTWERESQLREEVPEKIEAWELKKQLDEGAKKRKTLEVFMVESIVGKKKLKGRAHYEVKWKGFRKTTWEPALRMQVDVPELVEFWEEENVEMENFATEDLETKYGGAGKKEKREQVEVKETEKEELTVQVALAEQEQITQRQEEQEASEEEEEEEGETYNVQSIRGKKVKDGVEYYLIKWEGWHAKKYWTWEPCTQIQMDVPEIVEEYESGSKGD